MLSYCTALLSSFYCIARTFISQFNIAVLAVRYCAFHIPNFFSYCNFISFLLLFFLVIFQFLHFYSAVIHCTVVTLHFSPLLFSTALRYFDYKFFNFSLVSCRITAALIPLSSHTGPIFGCQIIHILLSTTTRIFMHYTLFHCSSSSSFSLYRLFLCQLLLTNPLTTLSTHLSISLLPTNPSLYPPFVTLSTLSPLLSS